MVFSSITFLYCFLPIILFVYFLAPTKIKNLVLLLGSVLFYAWGERLLVLMLAGTVFTGWLLGLFIGGCKNKILRRALMILSVSSDLALLIYFKYANFFVVSFNSTFGLSIPVLNVVLPIGISFYTFQLISYTVDVYWGKVEAQKNFINFATYVVLFPQLIAGPIVRYADVNARLEERTHRLSDIAYGVKRFIIGLSKKVIIANSLGELVDIYSKTSTPTVLMTWMYGIAFTLQIYYDFSGYSDMAIGLGRIFGFEFLENFNYPYISKNITEFWRRWHISLGTWFKDYVYIPLGGNRKGIRRQILNIIAVWMLTGLWHGASWNFVLWGVWYAFFLILEKCFWLKKLQKYKLMGHIYVFLVTVFGFVIFNADGLRTALDTVLAMLGLMGYRLVDYNTQYYFQSYSLIYILAIIGVTPLVSIIYARKLPDHKSFEWLQVIVEPIVLTGLLILCTAYLIDGSFNPFLYFRF